MSPDERWDAHPPLRTRLPLKFRNGATMSRLVVACSCGAEVDDDYAHGEILVLGNGYEVRSVAYCKPCNVLTFGSTVMTAMQDGKVEMVFNQHSAGAKGPRSPWPEDHQRARG